MAQTVLQTKSSSPPPAYVEVATSQPSHTLSQPPASLLPTPLSPHPGYGPTPIAQQTQLLPYYDPRSPHAIAEASSRARWRFIEALLWALCLAALASAATSWEIQERRIVGSMLRFVLSDSESWKER